MHTVHRKKSTRVLRSAAIRLLSRIDPAFFEYKPFADAGRRADFSLFLVQGTDHRIKN